MTQESVKTAIFPIFNFEVSEESNEKIKNGFQLSNNVVLRQISKEEIDRFQDPKKVHPIMWFDGSHLIYLINARTWVFEVKDTIIQPNQDIVDQAARLIYEVLLAMRLYKPESGFCKVYLVEELSNITGFGIINPPAPYRPRTCKLYANEIGEIDVLLNKLRLDLDKNSSFRVACERFSRSHEERRYHDKIVDLAIAFEALFTQYIDMKKSKLESMGKFVGLGCSMLLGKNDEERKEISKFIEKAFGVRNDIVHGKTSSNSPIEINGKEYDWKGFSSQLQEYLRCSIKKLI